MLPVEVPVNVNSVVEPSATATVAAAVPTLIANDLSRVLPLYAVVAVLAGHVAPLTSVCIMMADSCYACEAVGT